MILQRTPGQLLALEMIPRPAVFSPEQQQRRSWLIQETGAALRDDPETINRRGSMSATIPRSVWLDFAFTYDLTPYRLTFPSTAPTATLWMRGRFTQWEILATWKLDDLISGADLWMAVKATLDTPEMDVLHRWAEEAGPPVFEYGGAL